MSCLPIDGRLRMRQTKTEEVGDLLLLSHGRGRVERQLEGWANEAQGRIRHALRAAAPTCTQRQVCIRAHPRDGGSHRETPPVRRDGSSQERSSGRQSTRESRVVGEAAACRNTSRGSARMGSRNHSSIRGERLVTSNSAQRRSLSVLGGGGNRTPVPGRPSGSSTGVAAGKVSPRGSQRRRTSRLARVRCPAVVLWRDHRREPAHDAPPRSQAARGGRLPKGYLGSERQLRVGTCVCPAFNEASGTSARFPQTATVRVEASAPPY